MTPTPKSSFHVTVVITPNFTLHAGIGYLLLTLPIASMSTSCANSDRKRFSWLLEPMLTLTLILKFCEEAGLRTELRLVSWC